MIGERRVRVHSNISRDEEMEERDEKTRRERREGRRYTHSPQIIIQ